VRQSRLSVRRTAQLCAASCLQQESIHTCRQLLRRLRKQSACAVLCCAFHEGKRGWKRVEIPAHTLPTAKSLQWLRLADTAYASATAHGRQAAAGLLITLCVLSSPHSITRSPPPPPAHTTLERRRLATAGLLATLGVLHPRWHFCFLALLMLDVFSHWFQMYASLVSGAATHKVHLAPCAQCLRPMYYLARCPHKQVVCRQSASP